MNHAAHRSGLGHVDDEATPPLTSDAPTDLSIDDIAPVLDEALADNAWARAVGIIGLHWSQLLDESGALLDRALRIIPLNAFEQDARAAAVRDIRLHSASDAVDRMLGRTTLPDPGDLSELETLARSDRALSLLSVASSRMIAFRVRGRMPRAIQLASLVERLGRIAVVHQPGLIAARLPAALLQAGITRGLADDLPGAVLTLSDAYERAPEARALYVERDAAGKIALFAALGGDIDQAEIWSDRSDRAPEAVGWYRPRIALTADVARSLIATERLRRTDAVAALRTLEQPVNTEQGWGAAVSFARARYALAWGDRLGAIDAVHRDRERYADWLGDGSTLGPMLRQAEVDLLLSAGQIRQAQLAAETQADDAPARLAKARVALSADDPVIATRFAAAALNATVSTRLRVEALAVQAVAMQRRSGMAAAEGPFARLGEAIREKGMLLSALTVPADERARLGVVLPDDHGARDVFPQTADRIRITPQQHLVLTGLERGLTVRQIAAESHLSTNTVKSHARALYRRLEVTTRDEVLARAYEIGLL